MTKLKTVLLAAAAMLGATGFAVSAEKLKGVAPPPQVAADMAARAAASGPVTSQAYATSERQQIYVPITPCRVFNSSAPIPADDAVTFQISGTGNLTSQGGPNGGCGIPTHAKGVSITLSAIPGSAAGSFTAYPQGISKPGIVSLRYQASQSTTSGAIVGLSATGRINVYSTKPARAVGDVTGYYADQIQGLLSTSGSVYSGSTGLVSLVRNGAGSYSVTVDRNVTYCTPVAVPYVGAGVYASAYAFNGAVITVYTWTVNADGGPVLSDNSGYFYLTVQC